MKYLLACVLAICLGGCSQASLKQNYLGPSNGGGINLNESLGPSHERARHLVVGKGVEDTATGPKFKWIVRNVDGRIVVDKQPLENVNHE
jgi:hypothetical protein